MFNITMQKKDHTPELETGAVKAMLDLYDVMRLDVLSVNMRYAQLMRCHISLQYFFLKLLY